VSGKLVYFGSGNPQVTTAQDKQNSRDVCMTLGALPAVPEVISLSQLGPSPPEQQQKRDRGTNETNRENDVEQETSFTTPKPQDLITTPVMDSLATSSLYPGLTSYPMSSLYPVSALEAVRDEYGQSISATDNSINEQVLFIQRHAEFQEQKVQSSLQRFLGQSLNFRKDANYTRSVEQITQ
jgi:hypothetical protein